MSHKPISATLKVFLLVLAIVSLVSVGYVGDYLIPMNVSVSKESFPMLHRLNGCKQKYSCVNENSSFMNDNLTDPNMTAFANKSRIYLVNNSRLFLVGETIEVHVDLFDGYGKPRKIGGDDLRVRIYNNEMKAYASGEVLDHENGSYTARLAILWEGKSRIDVTLFYTREAIRALYHIRERSVLLKGTNLKDKIETKVNSARFKNAVIQKNLQTGEDNLTLMQKCGLQYILSTRVILAKFKAENVEQETRCHPFAKKLKGKDLCNLTLENGGLSWYCEKPSNINLLCHDWTEVKIEKKYQTYPITDAENALISKDGFGLSIPSNIEVKAIGRSNVYENLMECANVQPSITWNQKAPSGYYFSGEWKPIHCKSFSNLTKIKKSLQGRELIIFGDSTTRQWFDNLKYLLNCTLVTEGWSHVNWHKPAKASSANWNFSIQWLPHAMPFFVGPEWAPRRYTRPISAYLDEIGSNANVIIVIHMFVHMLAFTPDVFQDRVQIIARSVRHLLHRNPKAKIFIKGSHTFYSIYPGYNLMNDYFGYVFDDMLYKEFRDMHDKIVFLKIRDFTDAKKVVNNHPPIEDVEQMVKYMLSYLS